MRENKLRDSWRLGLRHLFSQNAAIIANLTRSKYREQETDMAFYSSAYDNVSYSAEIQSIYNVDSFKLITGIGHFTNNNSCNDLSLQSSMQIFLCEIDNSIFEASNSNAYLYSTTHLPYDFYLTAGGSIDRIDGSNIQKTTINPKLGITWLALPNSTIRFTSFKSQNRSLINDQTIEPTQFAGFNQFFDNVYGTEFWRHGIGIDHKLTNSIFLGYEWSKRNIELPGYLIENKINTEDRFEENSQRAYFNLVISDGLTIFLDYQYNKTKTDALMSPLITHKMPFGISWFQSTGFSLHINPIYVNQRYDFNNQKGDISNFLTLNATLRYRLPSRYGMLSMGVVNAFDDNFSYTTTDLQDPYLQPDRIFFSNLTLNFE
jgi:hypothetical protein